MPDFVPLDNVVHADLKVKAGYDYETGDAINQALVFPTEFSELQREYPIVFRRFENGSFKAVVLLGLDANENLFLEEGRWNAQYIPAIRLRGPFTLAITENAGDSSGLSDPVIQIDMDHPNVSDEEGMSIFLPQGGHSPYFSLMINTLKKMHIGTQVEAQFFAELERFNLIEEMTLEAKLTDTKQYTIPDVYTISKSRMAKLTPDELHELNQLGLLEHCFSIMSSMGNVSRLVDMKALKDRV